MKLQETFVKTDMNERGEVNRGILFEQDAAKHRQIAKRLSPAFSSRATRAKDPVINRYIDYFVERMVSMGADPVVLTLRDGVNGLLWTYLQ